MSTSALIVLAMASFAMVGAAPVATYTGQYNDPFTSATHPTLRIHTNGTVHDLQCYEPLDIEPNLDATGPVYGDLAHYTDAQGNHTGCERPSAGVDLSGKIVMVARGGCNFVAKVRNMQAANAEAVIIYDFKQQGFFYMAFDGTVQPEIPSVFIQKDTAEAMEHYLRLLTQANMTLEVTLIPDNENSLRLTLDTAVVDPNNSDNELVTGSIEARRTVANHWGTDYMKYKVVGNRSKSPPHKIMVSPSEWIVEPKRDDMNWMALDGDVLPEGHAMKGRIGESMFHMRLHNPTGCPERVAYVYKCQTTGAHDLCGQGCLEVLDENGYRVFNDHTCAFTEPLMWYCNVKNDANHAYSCEGERLLLGPPIVSQPNVCPAGQQQHYPFFDEWPPSKYGEDLGESKDLQWFRMTQGTYAQSGVTEHGFFDSYLCTGQDDNCTKESGDAGKGWRMKGGFATSQPSQPHNSISVLEYTMRSAVKPGAEVLYTYASHGERGYDYLEIDICQKGVCSNVSSFLEPVTVWKRQKIELIAGGKYTIKFKYKKDGSYSVPIDEARLLELAILGWNDDSQCIACPADHCSSGRFDGCQRCPSTTFSLAGSESCTACAATKPANSHFTMISEGRTADCTSVCDPGYWDGGTDSKQCLVRPRRCLLPKNSQSDGKFAPPSFAMLNQCLHYRNKNFACEDAAKTLLILQAAKQLDAQVERRTTFYTLVKKLIGEYTVNGKPLTQCDNLIGSDYEFQQKLIEAARVTNDASYIYAPPIFYQNLDVYLPVRFNYSDVGGTHRIFVDSLSELARMYGFQGKQSEVESSMGWEVVQIGGVPAEQVMQTFATTQVGFSKDSATRFDLAVRGDYPTLWTCSFAVRSLAKCRKPDSDTISLQLKHPTNPDQKTISLQWNVIYFGDDCNTDADIDQTTCRKHSAKDWLNCAAYSAARSAEQAHTSLSNDDMGLEDLAVELHHSWFDHKDLMATESLVTTSHLTHEADQHKLAILDSYEHVAAYSLLDPKGTTTGILRVASFHGEASEFHAVLMEIAALHPSRILIDLRSNGGGHVCHALQLAYLLSAKYTVPTDPKAQFDFRRTPAMFGLATNESFYARAHPEFQLAPENFIDTNTGLPYKNGDWYTDHTQTSYSDKVGMNCERYSSLLEFYVKNQLERTRKLLQFEKDRLQVLVDSQCVGACALFARTVIQEDIGTVVGVGTGTAGTAPVGLTADLNGLGCQLEGLKLEPDVVKVGYMPNAGQNIVLPLSRLYTSAPTSDVMPEILKPSATIQPGTPRADFKEGHWYSGMTLYQAANRLFDPSTETGPTGCLKCDSCNDSSGFGVGMALFFIFLGICLVPCCGGIGYYFSTRGCSADSVLALPLKLKEMCMCCVGSRWERSYGTLSGDPSEGMPGSGGCCQGFDWRSYIPGMKSSALEEQYSGLNEPMRPAVAVQESEMGAYAPAFTSDNRNADVDDNVDEKTANL